MFDDFEKTVALIESPFQAVQLKEYLHSISEKEVKIILRLNNNKKNNEQILKTIKLLALDRFRIVSCFGWVMPLIQLALHLKSDLVIGDENSIVFRVAKKFMNHNRFLVLDDGTATLKSNLKIKRFSVFNLAPGDVSRNSYKYLKRRYRKIREESALEPVALIIGGKFVEAGIVNEDFYSSFIDWQIKYIKSCVPTGVRIIYIPHRHENKYLTRLSTYIENDEISIEDLDIPIELVALAGKYNPVYVFGALSTALISMREIYNESNIVPTLMPDDRILGRRDAILNLNKWFKDNFGATISFPEEYR